jgi:aerobic-type carbon monoxide dehydrogenase small subunit (CoxS/CutS family)
VWGVDGMIVLKVNRKDFMVDVSPDTPLLWVIKRKGAAK